MKKYLCGILAIIIFIITAINSSAANSEKNSEKVTYDKELEKLKKSNPEKYDEIKKMYIFITERFLATLGYGIEPIDGILDKKTEKALKIYQKKRKIPETGDPLSFETIEQLGVDWDLIQYRPVTLPSLFVFTDLWDKGYVTATGTWVISNDKMSNPEQTSKIICDKNLNTCTEAIAIIGGNVNALSVDIETYDIERWDSHEIVTNPIQSGAGCVRYIRRFNRLQKTVTGIRSTISNKDICKGVEVKELNLVLTDGFKVYWKQNKEWNKKSKDLLNISPSLLKFLEKEENEKLKTTPNE